MELKHIRRPRPDCSDRRQRRGQPVRGNQLDGPRPKWLADAFQALLYPATNASLDDPSIEEFADAPIRSKAGIIAFRRHYERSPKDRKDPYFSPMRAESLADLPPALVVTANFDPLRDDGRNYAERLRAEGTPAEWINYPRAIHGMFSRPNHVEHAQEAYRLVIDRFQHHLGAAD